MSDSKPLKLVLLWHMHQPNYQEPGSSHLVLPWVRLHATKDYLDMLLAATRHENVRVTFNLVPSLLDQFRLYEEGGSDPHLELSRTPADQLSPDQRRRLLETFFSANADHMIRPYGRYHELYHKARSSSGHDVLPKLFSSEEMRDLQVWSNLAWVDPILRREEPVKSLFAQRRHFSEEQKNALLDWQVKLIGRILPAYREYLKDDRIEVSFTPYYHPILPLLCDTRAALEANPHMELPQRTFRHPEDAVEQIRMSMEKYRDIFDRPMAGMWPSEGSVSEEVANICIDLGLRWIATDQEILYHSLRKAGADPQAHPLHTVYAYAGKLKMLFRDHALSDRIGFVYSGWDADKAVADFIHQLKRIRAMLQSVLPEIVVPVILDGENAWEYFPDDGTEFLELLYETIAQDPEIEPVTVSEAVSSVKATPLLSLYAGSWINHNFRIWIGHHEDNAAWDLLADARQTLVDFEAAHPDSDRQTVAAAWRQIHIAEGSDWCWWYGDEHRGSGNEQFDSIFRRHLVAVYELLDHDVPSALLNPIYRGGLGVRPVPPDALVTPAIDGRLTHFYEWAGAGSFDCLKAGGSMHRVDRCLSKIHFAFDYDHLYIRLDFANRHVIDLMEQPILRFAMLRPEPLEVAVTGAGTDGRYEGDGWRCVLDEILELAVERRLLWKRGHGTVDLSVSVIDNEDKKVESWPLDGGIRITVPQKGAELFWPA